MDCDKIDRRAQTIDSDNSVRQKGIRTHAALISYFGGEDLTGKIKSPSSDVYAAFISVLTDSAVSGFRNRRQRSRESLRQELDDAFKQVGFVDPSGELSIPGQSNYDEIPSTSVGPLLPGIVAILEIEYGIESTEAVRQYRSDSLETVLPDQEQNSTPEMDRQPNQNWEENIRDAPGFDLDADAYVYVLELERLSDSSTWFYVGKREGKFQDLVGYIRSHASKFTRSRVVNYEGLDILLGNYNASMALQGTTHRVINIERIVPISAAEIASLDNSDAESCYISEIERRTAYEVALDHETTNVLGGK